MGDLESAIENYKTSQLSVAEAEQDLSTLNGKHKDLSNRLEGIVSALSQARDKKREALRDLGVGRINEESLSQIREESETLERAQGELKEMIEAIESAITDITRANPVGSLITARNECKGAQRRAWKAITEDLAKKQPKGFVEHIERLRAAQMQFGRSFGSINVEPFGDLVSHNPIPSPEQKARVSEIIQGLEVTYFK